MTNLRRQDFEPIYIPNGYVDILSTKFMNKKNIYGNKMYVFVTKKVFEIDTLEDYIFLEKLVDMFSIDKIKVGENYPPVVIAEIGINHNGNLDLAIELADSAIKSGIEIIKHQTHIIEDEMSLEAKKVVPGNSKQSIFDIIKKIL